MPVNDSPQEVPENLVSVREAARVAGVTPATVRSWIKRGRLTAQPSPSGRRVSLAAVRALVASPDPQAPADAVAIYEAVRLTDVTRRHIEAWIRQGRLPSWRGRYGPLVRVADVQALAVRDAARQVGVTKGRLYTWGKQGQLPVWLVPRSGQRVRLADVTALAERHGRGLPPKPGGTP